jgi:plastocyanin
MKNSLAHFGCLGIFTLMSAVLSQGCTAEKEFTKPIAVETSVGRATNGSVSGVVTYSGKNPQHTQRDDAGMRRDLLTIDPDNKGLADVIVYLKSTNGQPLPQRVVEGDVSITQEDFMFLPGVIGIRVGQNVIFGNQDSANHNVRADADNVRDEFNVMVTQQYDYEKVFATPTTDMPIRLSCDIHQWMDGWIYVFEHDLFAVTDELGVFSISDVPPGSYTLTIEQPDAELFAQSSIEVKSDGTFRVRCDFEQIHLYRRQTATPQRTVEE